MNQTHSDENAAMGQEERKSTRRSAHPRERAKTEMTRLRAAGRNLGAQLEQHVQKRPYVVMGAAVGLGFVAGSILGSRLGQVLLAAGIGYAAKTFLEGEIGMDRIQERLERLGRER
jgi:ElaB/YqjD/DUF883 family membrane-anchored ribosome-binding protein